MGTSKNATMVNKVSSDQTEKREKADQSGVYRITCRQFDSVYIGKTGRKFSTRMKEHASSKAKQNDKSLFGKHSTMRNTLRLHTETPTRRRKLEAQLEIVRIRKGKILINMVTKFESKKLFRFVIDGNRRTLSINRKHQFHGIILQPE